MLKKQLLWLFFMPFYLWGITITEDTVLSEDVVYNEDVIIDGVLVKLNGFTMTVNGDLDINGSSSRIQMTEFSDKLIVEGDLTFAGASSYPYLTNGVIELKGDFLQKGTGTTFYKDSGLYRDANDNGYAFFTMDRHKVILNGNKKQTVKFDSPTTSGFNYLEIKNTSNEGVVFEELNILGDWKKNNSNIEIKSVTNLSLNENLMLSDNLKVIGGTLNLNGYTLTVEGDLDVIGESSRIKMVQSSDKLIIKGNLTFAGATSYPYLTDGTIELKGDFIQKGKNTNSWNLEVHSYRESSDNGYSFYATDKHKVILNGTTEQIITFDSPETSMFANLEIENHSVNINIAPNKKLNIIDGLYLDEELYNSTYKDNEYITYGRYRDIHKTYMTLFRGLNVIALPIKQTITESQISSIFSEQNISHVLKYDSNSKQWQGFGNSEIAKKKIADNGVTKLTNIKAGEGFFVKTEGEVELKFPRDSGYGVDDIGIESLSSGWHLVGSNRVTKINSLLAKNRDIKVIRQYQGGEDYYWSSDEDVEEEYRRRGIKKFEENNATNSGFWIYVD